MPVKTGDTVKVHYSGSLPDGSVFDSSAGRDPIEFTVGAGAVIAGFETAIVGLEPGGKKTITIAPQDAYGPKYPELLQQVTKGDFVDEPFVGAMINLVSPEGEELPGQIVSIEGDQVTLDFNHPLAGETLTFEVELVEVVAGPN
jgi:peptidylprolyl isomerase